MLKESFKMILRLFQNSLFIKNENYNNNNNLYILLVIYK